MFEKFLDNLCSKETLIDVGELGLTTQSSFSYWSKENDSQRAVSGQIFPDFAFHTNKEQNPWWSISWKEPQKLDYIIINNRKKEPFNKISKTITVSILNENGDEIYIHSGNLIFGSLPNNMPLILPLYGEYNIKEVRIELNGNNYLHLCSIHFLKKGALQEKDNKLIFFATRGDGFAERLRTILNAMHLANIHKGDFKIFWPQGIKDVGEYHAIDKKEEIFCPNFIENHFIDSLKGIKLKNINELSKETLTLNDVKNFDGILVHQGNDNYQDLFNNILFTDKLSYIKSLAQGLVTKKTCAIHLRSGDVVYHYRFRNLFYNKTMPFYVLHGIINTLKKEDYEIILFSTEDALCEEIAKRYNIRYFSANSYHDLDITQRAFFDIILMSQCDRIIGTSSSGFATLPILIGKANKVEEYRSFFSTEDIIAEFQKSIAKNGILNYKSVSPFLKAYSIAHFVSHFKDNIDSNLAINVMTNCISLDPDNTYYKVLLSLFYYKEGRLSLADTMLLEELKQESKEYNIYWLSKDFEWRKYTTLSQYIADFKRAADGGSIVASILVLLHQNYVEKSINVTYYNNLLANVPSDTLGIDLLKQKLNEFIKR